MNQPDMSPEHLAHKINHSLHRLPLALEVLDEMEQPDAPFPGDHEMRHGAVQAVATMVQHLRSIEPIPDSFPNSNGQPSDAEQVAQEWLRGKLPEKVLPRDLHQELSTVLSKLVPTTRQ